MFLFIIDSIYTERYMGSPSPQDNYIGYERADLMKKVDSLKSKKFFLIHGTADGTFFLLTNILTYEFSFPVFFR